MTVRIVLVGTTHPGNIGAVARAMKNMGLRDLVLVNPRYFPHADATARASGAEDVLEAARVAGSLVDGIGDCTYVAGASARPRSIGWPTVMPRDCAARLQQESARGVVAAVFGPEKSGLTNEDLDLCHTLVTIPADPGFSSLNLAMAVQVLCYELRVAALEGKVSGDTRDTPLASAAELELFYVHLEQVLTASGFLDAENPRYLMRRLRRLFLRAEPDRNEINILRGILASIDPRAAQRPQANQGNRRNQGNPAELAADSDGGRGPRRLRMSEKSPDLIYLDNAATTRVDPAVAEAMSRCLSERGPFANPASVHAAGRVSRELVEQARRQIAALLHTTPQTLIFTSGATESNNLAIAGAAHLRAHRGRHLITMPTEHKAVTDCFAALGRQGFEVTWLEPDRHGLLPIDDLEAAIRADTQLVSIMHVNNETGAMQDIQAIGACCRSRGVLFHCDAAQSVGKLPLDLSELPVDLLSLTAHKFHGPQGIGALFLADRPECHIQPLIHGGGQERRLRPGTLAVHQIAGFGRAAAIAAERQPDDLAHLKRLKERLWSGIRDVPGVSRNGSEVNAFPGILNVSVEGIEGESLMLALHPLCVSSGSACNSQSGESSYVLRALGLDDHLAQSAIRFSFGRFTRDSDIDAAIERYRGAVSRLRSIMPAGAA